jgi:hypothetical protein
VTSLGIESATFTLVAQSKWQYLKIKLKRLDRGTAVHVLSSRSFVIHAPKMVVGLQAVAGGIAE